jgi:molecular chaperone GrpE
MTVGMDRDEILRRFEALLDSALAVEEPPSGLDAEILSAVMAGAEVEGQRCDPYALWSAVTALTQEIKLQGRAFQELNHTLAGQTEKIAEELRAVYAERERTVQRETERRGRKEALRTLIDLRDRLGRGRASVAAREAEMAAAPRQGWWARVFSKPKDDPAGGAIHALIRGYELGIERLDQTLAEFNAHEIRCQGESFDPRRMNAIESEESAAVPAGVVLEVYLSGYEWSGEVLRPAQVKVSREPANAVVEK